MGNVRKGVEIRAVIEAGREVVTEAGTGAEIGAGIEVVIEVGVKAVTAKGAREVEAEIGIAVVPDRMVFRVVFIPCLLC